MYIISIILLLFITVSLLYLYNKNLKESFINNTVQIPYTVLPKEHDFVHQNIPRVIYQTYKSNSINKDLYKNVESWINLNPSYQYEFYDDERIRQFLLKEYGPKYVERFDSIKVGASKSDYFRILIIYKYGGVYADLDNKLLKPLDEIINPEDTEILHKQLNNWYDTHVLMMSPNNELLYNCIQIINTNIDNKIKGTAIDVTGPRILRKLIKNKDYIPKKIVHQKDYIKVKRIYISEENYVYWTDIDYIFKIKP